MRLALYAHYGSSPLVSKHVLYHAQELRKLGFQVCFISNSPVSASSEAQLAKVCDRVLVRENIGFDFCMWQRGLADYDLSKYDELLLTNSSIVGPLQSLELLWQNSSIVGSDFWGLTDNSDPSPHVQSYFLVFKRRLLQSKCFTDFWTSVLPYAEKDQVIRSYEIGLTCWFQQNGFKWASAFPQEAIWRRYQAGRSFARKLRDRIHKRRLPRRRGRDITLCCPQFLIEAGFPFLKAALLRPGNHYLYPRDAYSLLQTSAISQDILEELRPKPGPMVRPLKE